jgi:hypothetical protein
MPIDVEALVVTFLRAQTGVTAICGDRIYTDRPHKPVYPLVLVNRTGGGFLYKNHLDSAEVSIQTFGGTHKAAYSLAAACITTMAASIVGPHTEGVVTKVKASAIAYEPDPESADQQGHARPRYTVSTVVTAHP